MSLQRTEHSRYLWGNKLECYFKMIDSQQYHENTTDLFGKHLEV